MVFHPHQTRRTSAEYVTIFAGGNLLDGAPVRDSYLARIRSVALMPGERVMHIFSATDGLMDEPPADGAALVATNRRVMAFLREEGGEQTFLAPLEAIQSVTVQTSTRGVRPLFQALLVLLGALVVYLIVAYQLTGRFEGPAIPVIHMDLGPAVVLIIALAAAWFVWKYYFTNENSSVSFQGATWRFSFPFRGREARAQIFLIVNAVFNARSAGR